MGPPEGLGDIKSGRDICKDYVELLHVFLSMGEPTWTTYQWKGEV